MGVLTRAESLPRTDLPSTECGGRSAAAFIRVQRSVLRQLGLSLCSVARDGYPSSG